MDRRNRLRILAFIFCLLCVNAACTAMTETADGGYVRVIALSKSNAELWVLAGGELIATSDDALEINGLNGDVQSLGDMNHVSLEAIAALSPDLVILFSTEPQQRALGEAAEAVGIRVFYTNIDGFEDYEQVMRELTTFTGDAEAYRRNVTKVREEAEAVVSRVPEDTAGGTYLFLHVSATKSKAEKNDYFACEIMNRLGLTNLAGDESPFDVLSLEAILTEDPDYIFVVPRGDEKKAQESFTAQFSSQPVWNTLSAVQYGHVFLLPKDLFGLKPNARWAEAYSQAFALLYGEQ